MSSSNFQTSLYKQLTLDYRPWTPREAPEKADGNLKNNSGNLKHGAPPFDHHKRKTLHPIRDEELTPRYHPGYANLPASLSLR